MCPIVGPRFRYVADPNVAHSQGPRVCCEDCMLSQQPSDGKFHLCLFGDGGFDLRDLLQSDSQQDELVARIVALTRGKAPGHRLHQGNSGATPHLASIGG